MLERSSWATWLALLFVPAFASPQATSYGRLDGVARDPHHVALPGVSVTLRGSAIMGQRSLVTDVDGSYRFLALPPGSYDLVFELSGFTTFERSQILVSTGTTTTINASLQLAGIEESLTVVGESPTVDVKTTRVGGTFDETALHDVPSATDLWGVLAQSPGVRMGGYDVGGSHKEQQTGYESFGVRDQNRIVSDGVDSTESSGGTGFYYDYYSVEEFQVSASGADVEMSTPGTSVVMTVKSGGNQLSGLVNLEYESEGMVGENIDDELAERGFTGNPVLLFWQAHADFGGPIVRDKAWFFGAYNHFTLEKVPSGIDAELATERAGFDNYVAKLSFELSERDQLIGYSQWGRKQNFDREISALRPPESAWDQDSWSWVHKAEWQRVWSGRLFSNVQVKHFGFSGPFVPKSDPDTHPQRLDTATGRWSGSGGEADFVRFKPQVSGQLNYFAPSGLGSHDVKVGIDWRLDSSQGWNTVAPPIRYLDNSNLGRPMNVDEISLANLPTRPDNRDAHFDIYAQDIWTVSDRLTLSLGARVSHQHAYYKESVLEPTLTDFYPSGVRAGKSLLTWFTVAPRLGLTYGLTGDGKTAVKAYFGRYYVNIADWLDSANPNDIAVQIYEFLDPNTNGLYDGPHELGPLVFRSSEGEGTPVNPDIAPTHVDEISFSLEREIAADTSVRVSYVNKRFRDLYGRWNRAQEIPLREAGVPCGDEAFPCPLDPFTGQPLRIARVPDEAAFAQDVAYDTFPDSEMDWDTLQVAASRRFRNGFFIQGNFDYQWRNELQSAEGGETAGSRFWQNHSLDVPYRQRNTTWQGKLLARYVFPYELAASANVRHQSGDAWAPIHRVRIPGSGTQAIFLEDVENNRSDNVTLVDVRFEKAIVLDGRHRITGMVDIYNLFNANPVTDFSDLTGRGFGDVHAVLDARTFQLGLRWQF